MTRKICVITGTRAEYGLLQEVMRAIEEHGAFQLQVIATATHLSPEHGMTYRAIEEDGFRIDEKLEMLLSNDSPIAVTKSMGLATIGFGEAFARLEPDLVVLLGDRYELLSAAESAMIARIPIAHIFGGDDTPNAFDNTVRHCVTKMSHLHFVTTEHAADRVRQMGENPAHVFVVGNPGIDQVHRLKLLTRDELEQSLNFVLRERNVLVTFHPVTLDFHPVDRQVAELLNALERLGSNVGLIFTRPNADTGNRRIADLMEAFCQSHPNAKMFDSLGQLRYLSAAAIVDAVVGNSSSGLCEIPSLKTPSVNIGDRQEGRPKASSVIQSGSAAEEILDAIQRAFDSDCSDAVNPYGDGHSAQRIVAALEGVSDFRLLLRKRFYLAAVPTDLTTVCARE